MTPIERPELFYKDKFCKAVCGYTDRELHDVVRKGYVDPIDEATAALGGRDMPRTIDEEIAGRFEIFMGTSFQFTLLDIPVEELYQAFEKFRAWEQYVHPRDESPNHADYWDPIYAAIEVAYQARNERAFKRGIVDMVDNILHD